VDTAVNRADLQQLADLRIAEAHALLTLAEAITHATDGVLPWIRVRW
jgi:hypothetical protein